MEILYAVHLFKPFFKAFLRFKGRREPAFSCKKMLDYHIGGFALALYIHAGDELSARFEHTVGLRISLILAGEGVEAVHGQNYVEGVV